MSYRTSTLVSPMLRKRSWLRPLCWLLGHSWYVTKFNTRKNLALSHLSPEAGIDKFCTRCGAEWYDAGEVWIEDLWYLGRRVEDMITAPRREE